MAKRKKYTHDYYRLDAILSHPSSYYIIVGERSNGKTYAVKERCLLHYHQTGRKFIYVRRFTRQKVKRRNTKYFLDIQDYAKKLFNSYVYYDHILGFYIINADNKPETIGYALSIEEGFDDKGSSFADCDIVVFEEFIERTYLDDEPNRFVNLLSTIIRKRKDVEVFMLGNTITKTCPYFPAFGIDVNSTKQGCISIFTHQRGVTIALERTKSFVAKGETRSTQKDKYFGFDSLGTVSMMLYGDWETGNYETKSIDGKTWASRRKLLHFVYSGLGRVYECSYALYKTNPVVFIRCINTQKNELNEKIQYVFSNIREQFTNKNGYVPLYNTYSKYLTDNIKEELVLFRDAIDSGRMIFTDAETGTEFMELYKTIN